jgi:hypothetical protein
MFSCEKSKDCVGENKDRFPFLYSQEGYVICKTVTINNSDSSYRARIKYLEDGTFNLYYEGNCNDRMDAAFCTDSLGNPKVFELNLNGSWEYEQHITELGGGGNAFLGGSSGDGYTRLNGSSLMIITDSSEPELLGDTIAGDYRMDCHNNYFKLLILKNQTYINLNCRRQF